MDRRLLGMRAESIARRHLEAHGLQLVCENYRCRFGELDLVLMDGAILVIVEVRLRSHRDYGGALGSIGALKQRRIARAARHLLMTHRALARLPVRFDVIALGSADGTRVEWLRGAFTAGF